MPPPGSYAVQELFRGQVVELAKGSAPAAVKSGRARSKRRASPGVKQAMTVQSPGLC